METAEKTMGLRNRLSMNTSLKNANIFDDDAWTEVEGKPIKKEKMDVTLEDGEIEEDVKKGVKMEKTSKIKTELISIKEETKLKIKQEKVNDNDQFLNTKTDIKVKRKIKQEEDIMDMKERFIDQTTISEEKMQATKGKKIPIKKEVIETTTDETVLNGLNNFAFVTPIKNDIDETPPDGKQLRSAKRTIFTRNSPYKKEPTPEYEPKGFRRTIITRNSPLKREHYSAINSDKGGIFNRLGPKLPKKRINSSGSEESIASLVSQNNSESDKRPVKSRLGPGPAKKKCTKERESDPETLARRQKQIDYGKNTLGYDNYAKVVAKHGRSPECPKTPDKYQKYSRRAWDGLIRQWRVKLHKYDPEDVEKRQEPEEEMKQE